MPSEVMRGITPPEVTPWVGKGALGTWRAWSKPIPDTAPVKYRLTQTEPSPTGKP